MYHNGRPAVRVTIQNTNQEDLFFVARAVKDYIEKFNSRNQDVQAYVIRDGAEIIRERINILSRNGILGLVLVLLFLSLSLNMRMSFWVALAIPISFAGMCMVAPFSNLTINVMSLLGMILVLGIVQAAKRFGVEGKASEVLALTLGAFFVALAAAITAGMVPEVWVPYIEIVVMGLGGALGTTAVLIKQELLLIVAGGLFVIEALSVILQVGSFKLRGQRIFRMSPLHHHFELSGWSETKVVIRFWIIALIFALLALATLKLR